MSRQRASRIINQRGDTLVEVLICVLIVSIVLMGAYVTTQRSSRGIRNSQEHAEALKLVQSQLEQVRSDAESSTPQVFTSSQPFCMVNEAAVTGTNATQCAQDATGSPTTGQPRYQLAVTRTDSAGASLFTVRATWDDINGSQAQETLHYRLYRP